MSQPPYITFNINKRSCVFILTLRDPLATMALLSNFLYERKMQVEWIQYQSFGEQAKVTILCQVENDRITRTIQLLSKIPNVLSFEWMAAKGSYEA